MTAIVSEVEELQQHLVNRLDPVLSQARYFAGIIGDRPSQYAKSPTLWNAAFKSLRWEALFVPFDVNSHQLAGMVTALRRSDRLLGFSVTVPYKVSILEHLDELDPKARQIGAVNTVVRTPEGRLIGYNTDGIGFLRTLSPLFASLRGLTVVMIGAGGAARAVGFYLAEAIGDGALFIANRTRESADSLAREIHSSYRNASALDEKDLPQVAASADLIVNCSTRGQGGIRKLSDGSQTILEPYSCLAPASPVSFRDESVPSGEEFHRHWFEQSYPDIERNNRLSAEVVVKIQSSTIGYDLIYSPLESVFLRQMRLTGHRVIQGKQMNIEQAADAFCEKVCRRILSEAGLGAPATFQGIVKVMSEVW